MKRLLRALEVKISMTLTRNKYEYILKKNLLFYIVNIHKGQKELMPASLI